MADKAVISSTHVKETFLKLIEAKRLDSSFLLWVKDTNFNGESILKLDVNVKELLHFRGRLGNT